MIIRERDGRKLCTGVRVNGLQVSRLHVDVFAARHDVQRLRSWIVLGRVGPRRQVDRLLFSIGIRIANARIRLRAVCDEDGWRALAYQYAVRVSEAAHGPQVCGCRQIEDLDGAVILRCKQESIAIEVCRKVVKIPRISGQGGGMNQADRTVLTLCGDSADHCECE